MAADGSPGKRRGKGTENKGKIKITQCATTSFNY